MGMALILGIGCRTWLPAAEEVVVDDYSSQEHRFQVVRVGGRLSYPWALAFLPDATALISERGGRLYRLRNETLTPIEGLPAVFASGQGGLLDVAVDPQFARTQRIFFSFSEAREGGYGTALARARLSADRLEDLRVIFRMNRYSYTTLHFGSRPVSDAGRNDPYDHR